MNNLFFNLSVNEQVSLIQQAEGVLGLSETVIEKDLWVCWLLGEVFALPIPMSFKGGTSLSKSYSLIKRFSEDCDITIDYRHFQPEIDLHNISRSQLKKLSESLKSKLQEYVKTSLLPHLKERVQKNFPDKLFEITLSESGEQIRFYYPSVLDSSKDYLRDHVLLEFGIRNSVEPSEICRISPYLASIESAAYLFQPIKINTLSPTRTFWEKATLIHVECHRERFIDSPERLSRHWYDLYLLFMSWVGEEALEKTDILYSVLNYKRAFFNASYANYDECTNGNFTLVPNEENLSRLEKDYRKMIEAGMFQNQPPKFSTMLEKIKELEKEINLKLTARDS